MTKLSKLLLMGLAATVGLAVAITVVHAQQGNGVPQQGGADSPERQAVQNTPVPAAPGFQRCATNFSHSPLASGLPLEQLLKLSSRQLMLWS
jgi:hypothetical protein